MKERMERAAYTIMKATSPRVVLTPREKEILQLIVDGNTNFAIAEKLFLSAKTIDKYRTNLMVKLEVNHVAALVKKALKMGLAE